MTESTGSPPTKARGRWPKFGLRFLFVLITITAIWLAIVSDRIRARKRAVEQLNEIGADVVFDYEFDDQMQRKKNPKLPAPSWLVELVGADVARTPIIVNFRDRHDLTDDDLAILASLHGLKQLNLFGCVNITDDGLRHLQGLTNLEVLALQGTKVNGEGLRFITQCQRLYGLALIKTRMTDDALVHVGKLRGLTWLMLSETEITNDGLRHLSDLPILERIEIRDTRVTNEGLKHLVNNKSLKLVLAGARATKVGREWLEERLPGCAVK